MMAPFFKYGCFDRNEPGRRIHHARLRLLLERAGFGKRAKLVSQFYLNDMRVQSDVHAIVTACSA